MKFFPPYVIYDLTGQVQNEYYYFPVYNKNDGQITMNFTATAMDDTFIIQFGTEYLNALNKIDYADNVTVAYRNDLQTYFETENLCVSSSGVEYLPSEGWNADFETKLSAVENVKFGVAQTTIETTFMGEDVLHNVIGPSQE